MKRFSWHMKRFSWYTEPGLAPHWYKIFGWLPNRYLPIVMFDSLPIYKPCRKGGHRHNHVRNATARMRRCHICGDPIVWGCEVISDWTNAEFMCRECCRNDAEDYCSAVGINFGGVTFQTRRR